MSLWAALEPPATTVEAGASAEIAVRIRNTGDIVEEYHVDVVGDPAQWCSIEPSTVRLYPGTSATVRLTFTPPRSPDAAAGPHPFGARVSPAQAPEAVVVPEGTMTVAPFVDLRAELLPPTVRGWRGARPRLVVDNYGNVTATAAVGATAQGNLVDFDIRRPSLQVPPGRAYFNRVRLRPQRLLWTGQKVSHPYSATVQPSGSELVSTAGTYAQTALLPRWTTRLAMGLAVLLAAFAGLWFSIHPEVSSDTTAKAAARSPATVSVGPGASAPPSSAAPSSSAPAGPAADGAPSSNAPATTGLPTPVSWWKLNGGPGGTTATTAADSAGANTAFVSNAVWCDDEQCLDFAVANASALTPNSVIDIGPSASFTVTAMVYMPTYTLSTSFQTMVSENAGGTSGFFLQFLGSNGNDDWAFSRPGARAVSNVKAAQNAWTYLAGVYDDSDHLLSIYVDGAPAGTQTYSGTPAAATGGLVMGRADVNGRPSDFFTGLLANIQVYQQALTANQINAIPAYRGYQQ